MRGHVCYADAMGQYVAALLAERPAHELLESRAKAQAELARLTVEVEQIDQALAKQAQQQARRPGTRGRRKGASGGTRERVIQVVRAAPGDTISPAQIIAAMRADGSSVSSGAIRNMIRRLVEEGDIDKVREGVYKLASRNGSSPPNPGPTEIEGHGPLLTDLEAP